MPKPEPPVAMPKPASPVAVARRHVAEAEARVARQQRLVVTLERDKHVAMAEHAREILDVLKQSLRLARVHLELEIQHYGDDAPVARSKPSKKPD